MAKNTSVIERLAAVNRGFLKKFTSSIGWSVVRSQTTKASSSTSPTVPTTIGLGAAPALRGGLDDGVEQGGEPGDRQDRAEGVELAGVRVLRGRDHEEAGEQADDHDRDVHEEHRAPVEVLDQEAAGERPEGAAETGDAGPGADGLAPLVGGEEVGDDRQRGRHDQRAADAHERPGGDQLARRASPWPRPPSRCRRARSPTWSAPRRPNRSPRLPAVSRRPANTRV